MIRKSKKSKLGKTQIIAGAFLLTILIGAFLLMLPLSSRDGSVTGFIDALFMSTTSVCVTGLVTVNVAMHWSLFGKFVILTLIQLGGIGVVTVILLLLVLMGRRITMKERMLIQETYNLDTMSGLVKLIVRIAKGIFIVEGIGAFFYAFVFVPEFGLLKGILFSIFHSVSAFCNAGIDLIGSESLVPYVTNPLINFTTMALIVVAGIGFPVWWDILRVLRLRKPHKWRRLELHSKLAISCSLILIFGGAILYFLLEFHNPATFGNLSVPEKMMAALFQSVTTRTAGFCTVLQQNLTDASSLITLILMFIGGAPAGTAGGIKVTTMALLVLCVVATVKGRSDIEIFGRRINRSSVNTGIAVIMIALAVVFTDVLLLLVIEGKDILDTVFEVVTAIGTVGLTRGITSELSWLGKLFIIITMYIGRIGPITMVLAFGVHTDRTMELRDLPEERILIG